MATSYVPPRDAVEEVLVALVGEVLSINRVGVDDDFFALGGDSIKGAILINRLQERLGEIIYVAALFQSPTVAALAAYLKQHYRHRIAALLGEEDLGQAMVTGSRLNEADLAHVRFLIPASREPVSADRNKNPPAVFLLAPPRSGTTLLRVMLAGHSRLFAPPELELLGFHTLRERSQAFSGSRKFWLEGTLRAVMAIYGCDAAVAQRRMDEFERQDLSVKEFYRELQQGLQGRLLVDKTPSYALNMATLQRAERDFDRPYYIHLLRHPRGMIRSFEKAHLDQIFFPYEHSYAPRELAELIWTLSHENILNFLADVPTDRQHVLRFEDLLKSPQQELERLCEFLQLPLEPAMLDPYGDIQSRMTDGPHQESRFLGDVKFREHGAIQPNVADAWKDDAQNYLLGPMTEQMGLNLGYQDQIHGGRSAHIPQADRSQPLPLSFAQERLWFLDQLIPDNPYYNMPGAVRLQGPLNVDAVRRAFAELVRRHETLRTSFRMQGGQPTQVIESDVSAEVPLIDLTTVRESVREAALRHRIAEESSRPFNLSQGPLIRARLYRVGEDDHVLFFSLHHIISDGWSHGVLRREVTTLYTAFSAGLPSPLPELPIQYADFAQWQRQWLSGEILQEQLGYWESRLAGLPNLELPLDRQRPAIFSGRGGNHRFQVSRDLTDKLKALGRNWTLALARRSRDVDMRISTG